jgi:hypothetical protein
MSKSYDHNDSYQKVLELVKGGVTSTESLKILKIAPKNFYNNLTPLQKVELNMERRVHTKYGIGSTGAFKR